MQTYTGLNWLEARELAVKNPHLFRLLLDAAAIKNAAEPIAYAYADLKRKDDEAHQKKIAESISKR